MKILYKTSREIVRFSELQNGVLFAEIEPRHQILTYLGDHFTKRFPMENWMIYDKTHRMFLVHKKGKRWILAQDYERQRQHLPIRYRTHVVEFQKEIQK